MSSVRYFEMFKNQNQLAQLAVYTPSFIVAHGHIGFDDRLYGEQCVIYPPTVLNGARLYEPSQLKALQMLKELAKTAAFALTVSVAMFGRKYRPVENGDLRIGTECTNQPEDHLVPYEVALERQSLNFLSLSVPESHLRFTNGKGLYEQWAQQRSRKPSQDIAHPEEAHAPGEHIFIAAFDRISSADATYVLSNGSKRAAYGYGEDGQAIASLSWSSEADYGYTPDDESIATRVWNPEKESASDEADFDFDQSTNQQPGSRTVPVYYPLPRPTTTTHTPLPAQSPMPKSPLICIYGEATNESVEFPENGLCEFMFYEGLYGTGQPQLNVVNILASARPLNHFASEAAAPSSTQYGLSLRYGAQVKVAQDVESHDGRRNIAELWKRGIRHYGFLNIDFTRFDAEEFRDALATLRVLNNTLQGLRTKATEVAYTGLGFYVVAGNRLSVLDALTAVYTPSFIVAHGHIGFDELEYGGKCFVYPPTIMNGAMLYEPSQLKALEMLEELNKTDACALVVSVAMFGRKYRAVENGDLRIGTECTYHSDDYLVPYEVLCTNTAFRSNVTEDPTNKAIFSYDDATRWVVTFDNELTLRTKLCEGKSQNLALEYGVAVYGMEYSDYAVRCPDLSTHGSYTRLLMVKKVRDFLTGKFTKSDDEEHCNTITL
ncbi:uncharacterized protein LOC144160027 [Haemaphysalis longicornis]